MNIGIDENSPVFEYYDSDYPSKDNNPIPENFDEKTKYQGLAFDIDRYKEIAGESGGPVLELCCGTGRVALPIARDGHKITGVDISGYFLKQFEGKIAKQTEEVTSRITLVEQDITKLSLDRKDFNMAFMAFNSLICLPALELQRSALKCVHKHLSDGAVLILDIINPLVLDFKGSSIPTLFYTRKNIHTGNYYSRFALMGPFDEYQKQELHGWYDEITPQGQTFRKYYSMFWRPAFRIEIELLLNECGFTIKQIDGGHQGETYTSASPRMFILAVKK